MLEVISNRVQNNNRHMLDKGIHSSASGEKGKLHGNNIQALPTVSSLLEDAKEEVSLMFNERLEKRLSRRSVSSDRNTKNSQKEVKRLRELISKVPDIHKNLKLKALVETLNERFPENAFQLLLHLKQFNRDPSLQFVALQLLSAEAQVKIDQQGDRLGIINDAMTELVSKKGPAIRAGLNVSVTAAEFEGRLNTDTQGLRDTYRDSVLDYGGITETYRSLVKRHGEGAFETVRKFLVKGLSADYGSAGPSIDKSRLKAIMDDMYALKLLGGLHIHCQDIMHTMRQLYGQIECKTGQELMARILDVKDEAWAHVNQVSKIPEEMKIKGISHQSYFLGQVSEVVREIPEKAFPDRERRHQLLGVFKEALEQLFNKEQEA